MNCYSGFSLSVILVCAICVFVCVCVQHLVKDQRVLKLVQRLAAKEEGEGEGGEKEGSRHISDDWEELTAYVSRRRSTVCAATLLYMCRLILFYIYGTVSLSGYVHVCCMYVCLYGIEPHHHVCTAPPACTLVEEETMLSTLTTVGVWNSRILYLALPILILPPFYCAFINPHNRGVSIFSTHLSGRRYKPTMLSTLTTVGVWNSKILYLASPISF